jgi:hypothetical protein
MLRTISMTCVLCVLALSTFAGDENPYKAAKVGDWAEYKSSTDANGFKMESKMKQTVKAKTDTEVTVSIEMDMGGQKNTQETKIDLTKAYDPTTAGTPPGAKPPKVEKGKEGDETVSVGGKEYKSHWIESKVTMEMGGQTIATETKTWMSKDVPLGGLVKSETKMNNGIKVTMELTGSGSK